MNNLPFSSIFPTQSSCQCRFYHHQPLGMKRGRNKKKRIREVYIYILEEKKEGQGLFWYLINALLWLGATEGFVSSLKHYVLQNRSGWCGGAEDDGMWREKKNKRWWWREKNQLRSDSGAEWNQEQNEGRQRQTGEEESCGKSCEEDEERKKRKEQQKDVRLEETAQV